MKRIIAITAVLMLFTVGMAGCTNWERVTFQTLSASKATIDQAQADYEIGAAIPHNVASYRAIVAARVVHNTAVNHMVTYEQLKATGASSSELAEAETQTTTALAELPAVIVQIKSLYSTVK
jgi:hypothetical protein